MRKYKGVLLVFALLSFSAVGSELSTDNPREYLQDGHPVADMCSDRIPPACILGVTVSSSQYPPSFLAVIPWLYRKTKPALASAFKQINKIMYRFDGKSGFRTLLAGK